MDFIIVSDLNLNLCMLCGRNYPHKKIYYKTCYEGLKQMEHITECATCRNLLRRKKEIDYLIEERKILAKSKVNEEWERFIKNIHIL